MNPGGKEREGAEHEPTSPKGKKIPAPGSSSEQKQRGLQPQENIEKLQEKRNTKIGDLVKISFFFLVFFSLSFVFLPLLVVLFALHFLCVCSLHVIYSLVYSNMYAFLRPFMSHSLSPLPMYSLILPGSRYPHSAADSTKHSSSKKSDYMGSTAKGTRM